MPIYGYYCQRCGHEWEEIVKVDGSNAPNSCMQCQAPEIERIPSGGTGFKLKGRGYYNTDYGGKAHKSSGNVKFEKKMIGKKDE